MKWTYKDLKKWIDDGCYKNIAKNVIELDCSYNQLTVLPLEIGQLINLQIFNCYHNKLTVLPPEIGQLINLQIFNCYHNKLTVLPPEIGQLINLHTFICCDNKLTVLPSELGQLINLQRFHCSSNKLTVLPSELGQLINLQRFHCSSNKLTILPSEIGQLINLQTFSCSCNKLTVLPSEIGQLINLQTFNYSNNEIEYIPPNVQRLINRLRQTHQNGQGIYNDTQSVHNHNIQECIRKSISYVMSQKPSLNNEQLIEFVTENDILNKITKQILFEYMEDINIHTIIGITFNELLLNVISLIANHEHKNEILYVLNIEMEDADCKCFTGRISRLVNCLNGYDENVQIKIADNEQIANVILQIKNKYGDDIETIKEKVNEQLNELGYEQEIIDSWMEHLE